MKLKNTLTALSFIAMTPLAFAGGENCQSGSCDKELTVAKTECSAGNCEEVMTVAKTDDPNCGCDSHKTAVKTVAKTECAGGSCDKEMTVATKKCDDGSCDKEMTVATKECADGSCDKEMTVATKECADGSCDKEMSVATKECADGSCDKEMTVANKECTDGSCDESATAATFVVSGMTCTSCSDKVNTTLTAVEGVKSCDVCHKSGGVTVKFDDKKTDREAVLTALKSTGFTVTSEQLEIPVSGMNCGACSKKLTTALNAIDGCEVNSVCHKSGHATVTIDPAKTSEAKIMEAIKTTGYKVEKTADVKTEASAPAKS